MSNLALWDKVQKTDPKHTKPITGKTYQGTSPKPHYLIHKATETFGPVVIGWGFTIVDERIEEGAGGERMHIARVKVWFKWEGERGEVEHIGGTQFSGIRSSGKAFTDEDAPKKSVTDALIKALSMIGFAGDIFMGRYDDSKYVDDLKAEASQPAPASLTPEQKARIEKAATALASATTVPALQRLWTAVEAIDQAELPNADYERLQTICNERLAVLKKPKPLSSEHTPFDEKETA